VGYWNEACSSWKNTDTGLGGSFELIGLPPGPSEISINPEVSTGLACFLRCYYLNEGEEKDLEIIKLQRGALISGIIQDATSNPLPGIEYRCAGRFDSDSQRTGADGSFAVRVPPGEYTLTISDGDIYTMVPEYITVTDVSTPLDMGTLTAYDDVTGDTVSGTVNITGIIPDDMELNIFALLNSQTITTDNFGGISTLSWVTPDAVTGAYSLFVPPTTARPDNQDVKIMLVLQRKSLTLISHIR